MNSMNRAAATAQSNPASAFLAGRHRLLIDGNA
jgi:hypothetical protein